MTSLDLVSYLQGRPYPGRGIIVARPDPDVLAVSVFLSGRSEESRCRKIVRSQNSYEVGPTTDVAEDPLRHYQAAVATGTRLVAGNGRHVCDLAASGHGPETVKDELTRLEHEPDRPIFTPRLALVADVGGAGRVAMLAIAAHDRAGGTEHRLHALEAVDVGCAWVVHTYDGSVSAPDASGFIACTSLGGATDGRLATRVWNALDARYRVAVAAIQTRLGQPWADGEWAVEQRFAVPR
jgi:IMP cyclohydrolase-like protein